MGIQSVLGSRVIWIIGGAGTGKTSLAKVLTAFQNDLFHVETSAALRPLVIRHDDDTAESYRQRLADKSFELRDSDPLFFVRPLNEAVEKNRHVVITGTRNPFDFMASWKPSEDAIILLGDTVQEKSSPAFDQTGIRMIRELCAFRSTYYNDVKCIIELSEEEVSTLIHHD